MKKYVFIVLSVVWLFGAPQALATNGGYIDIKLGSIVNGLPPRSGNLPADFELGASIEFGNYFESRIYGKHHSNADVDGQEYAYESAGVGGRLYILPSLFDEESGVKKRLYVDASVEKVVSQKQQYAVRYPTNVEAGIAFSGDIGELRFGGSYHDAAERGSVRKYGFKYRYTTVNLAVRMHL